MSVKRLEIPEVLLIEKALFKDNRGWFSEFYNQQDANLPKFVQQNAAFTKKGGLRGLHWQEEPHFQEKLVSVLSGKILDVAVDIRKDSKTFGRHVKIELVPGQLLFVPKGFAHGFQALEDSCVTYLVSNFYFKGSERGINFLSPSLKINLSNIPLIMSEKDRNAKSFEEVFG